MPEDYRTNIFRGTDLESAIARNSDAELPDEVPAVYSWHFKIELPKQAIDDGSFFDSWIGRLLSVKSASIDQYKISYSGNSKGLTFGGRGLTPSKQDLLNTLSKRRAQRKYIGKCLSDISLSSSPLYIGKAVNLRRRVKQHIEGNTELSKYIEELGMSFDDLILRSFEFPGIPVSKDDENPESDLNKILSLYEMMAQAIFTPFGTKRPG